jgi:gamma-glutamylcyclotransferase (GGCT)/AIG2-like uncharacterized protein YtfP
VTGDRAALFVYGTLLPGEGRWHLLRPLAASWAPASAGGRLWDTGQGYPAAVFGEGGLIPGALVRLAPGTGAEALRLLDALEGEGRLYSRVSITTSAGEAIAYEWLRPTQGFRLLPDGWRRR